MKGKGEWDVERKDRTARKSEWKKSKTDPGHPVMDTGQMMEAVDYEVVKL